LKTVPNKQKSALPTKEKDDKKNRIIRRNPSNINQYIFLGYFIPAIILDIKQYIVKLIENTIQEMFKDMKTIRIMQKEEIITPSLPYKTTMLNVTNATTMVMKLVNVDCQSMTKR
jgi:hypothetical protein